jgi:hypothetical protein
MPRCARSGIRRRRSPDRAGDPGSAGLLINAKADSRPGDGGLPVGDPSTRRPDLRRRKARAGAAVAATGDLRRVRVHALVPSGMENAFLPLLRNCNQIDVILPEWFEIKGASLAVSSLEVDPEMLEALAAIRSERPGEIALWPVFGLAETLTAEGLREGPGRCRDARRAGRSDPAGRQG